MVQATPEIRRALLRTIDAPQGTVTVSRQITPAGDKIVVSLAPGVRIPDDRLPRTFQGIPVKYERRRSAKAFA